MRLNVLSFVISCHHHYLLHFDLGLRYLLLRIQRFASPAFQSRQLLHRGEPFGVAEQKRDIFGICTSVELVFYHWLN